MIIGEKSLDRYLTESREIDESDITGTGIDGFIVFRIEDEKKKSTL